MVYGSWCMVQGLGIKVCCSGLRDSGLGSRVGGFTGRRCRGATTRTGCLVWDFGVGILGLGFRAQGVGFGDFWFGVLGSGL
jgi:hypothetical protein